jgi:two-component system, LytTR family, sensor kinase
MRRMKWHSGGESRWVTALLIFLIFSFKFLLFVPQVYLYNASSPSPLPWGVVLLKLALGTYSWAALTPLIIWVSRRWPIERQHLTRNLLRHLCLSFPFAAAQTLVYHGVLALLMRGGFASSAREVPRLDGPWSFILNGVVAYVSILAVHQAVLLYRRANEREFRLQQAQLRLLQTQLQPHFLFNSLNAVASLIYRNPAEAERTVLSLSELLRANLYKMDMQETTLGEELEFVWRYLQIMDARFPGQFAVRTEVEPGARDACVPTMLLQPLVENAIRHGLLPGEGRGRVEISARREGRVLRVCVRDDGRGAEPDGGKPGGIGLTNMRARLQYLYGPDHRFEFHSTPDSGTIVDIRLPFRVAATRM